MAKRVKVIMTAHTIGPLDARVLNRELQADHVDKGLSPRLEPGDHVEVDDLFATELFHVERAVPATPELVAQIEAAKAATGAAA